MESFDVYGVCNPLIDLLSHIPDSFLEERGLEKNIMRLVTLEEQQELLMALAAEKIPVEFAAGGSGANTTIGIAQLGGTSAFSGKVGQDEHSKIYKDKLEEMGVQVALSEGKGATGSSLILVSEDGSRLMNTHLGISIELQPPDIQPELIEKSKYLYVTGYLWDTESQKNSVRKALKEAQKMKVKVSLSLSDPFCVTRHKNDFLELLKGYASMVICNQEELHTLMETNITQNAVKKLSEWVETAVVTLGSKGSLVIHNGESNYINPSPVKVVDTTGAGDAYAAGFLFGMTHDFSPLDSGRIGAVLASAVIKQTGPRYQGHVHALIREKLGIRL